MDDERNPDRIWLAPSCSSACDEYRCWSEEDLGPCEECGRPCVMYVRADLARVPDKGE